MKTPILEPDVSKVSAMVRAELLFGAAKSDRPDVNREKVKAFLLPFETLPFDGKAADHYARVRIQLERAGTPIGPNDLIIAATALARSASLVTHNLSEFSRVPGLLVEDWLA